MKLCDLSDHIKFSDEYTALRIPNEEVKTIFAETVAKWFTDTIEEKDHQNRRVLVVETKWASNQDHCNKTIMFTC